VKLLGGAKFRNAGQVCISPTRFLVQEDVYEEFVDGFVQAHQGGEGRRRHGPADQDGPVMHARRVEAMEGFVADAQKAGANLRTGGKRIGNQGYFFEPTVFTEVPLDARVMNEEPFGPIASIVSFKEDEEAFEEANRLPYGLAAYAYTRSAATATKVASVVETGMMSVNHQGLGIPELPFGGVKDSGYGSEGGLEAIEGYLNTKLVSQMPM
jgi:succinate-semialdehyde dehydrogenase/glutarate-semialdehyde dehydrogenase